MKNHTTKKKKQVKLKMRAITQMIFLFSKDKLGNILTL